MLTAALPAPTRHASQGIGTGVHGNLVRATFLLLLALSSASVDAAEVYTIRFISSGPLIEPPCRYLGWSDHMVFHNTTNEDAVIRLLGVSNGPRRADARDLTVPARSSRSVAGTVYGWNPDSHANLWVNRLDIPSGVLLTSRLQVSIGAACPGPPVADSRGVGATGLPTFSSLRPANEPQYHLGTDLGPDATGYAASARINVGIYNAGSVPATATVEVYRGCDERLIDSRIASIPADTIVQIPGLSTLTGTGCPGAFLTTAFYSTYVVVRVDQPSFSYTVTLSNEVPPQLPIGVSFTR